jgi:FkbM family methyltransferase
VRSWPRVRIGVLRRLPASIPGKARLSRALLHEVRSRENVIVESSAGARFVVPHLAEPVAFHLLVDGRYEPETEDFISRRLSAGDVFVDAGASIGVFAVSAARKVGPRGRVVALEPSPAVFPYLEQNIRLNRLENIAALPLALSDETRDRVPFYAAPASHFGMGALAPQFDAEPSMISTRQLDEIVRDTQLPFVSVLKVDVEGHELAVFRGARRLLETTPGPAIVFEFCDWAETRFGKPGQAQEFLMHLGYRLWRLRDYRHGHRPLAAPLRSGWAMLVAERTSSPS